MDIESASSAKGSLVPGFRFHPTDEELVRYYLRRKIGGKPFRFDAISEIDIYKVEPWDLPDKSKLKSRDLEWYFFSVLDKKYGNGSKTNRATDRGYWKTTGKDRAVFHRNQIVGMKKTLVYHSGRAPRGERTNWVMHEYRLIDEEMEKSGIVQDAFVLCRIFLKSGSGPKNGEKYGAPFMEEEWEDDDLAIVPKDEYAEELPLSDDSCLDAYLDENDLEQILNAVDPSPDTSLPLSFAYGEENHYVEEPTNCINDPQNFIVDMDENNHVMEQPDGGTLFNLPVQYDMDGKAVKREFIGESSYSGETSNTKHPVDLDYLLNEPFLDAMDNPTLGEGAFIESNDLKQPAEMDPSSFDMLDEYLQFFDATDDNLQNLDFDYSDMMGSDALALPSDPASLLPYENVNKGKEDIVEGKEHLDGNIKDFPSSSKQAQTKFGSDFQYPFMEKASQMLGNIHAPSAFASEFPKDAALRMNSTSSSAVRVIAGMIQIRDLNLSGPGMDLSFSKQGRVYITLSFGMPRGDDYSVDSDKANSVILWGWFRFMFMWMLFATMSCKIGTYICAK